MEIILVPVVFQAVFTLLLMRFFIREEVGVSYLDILLGVLTVHLMYKTVLFFAFDNDNVYQKLHGAFSLLYGPLLYQLTKTKISKEASVILFHRKTLWHFMPFLLIFVLNIYVVYQVIVLNSVEHMDHYHLLVYILSSVSGLCYAIAVFASKSYKKECSKTRKGIIRAIGLLILVPPALGLIAMFTDAVIHGRLIWYISIFAMLIYVLWARVKEQKHSIDILKAALDAEKDRQKEHKQKVYAHSSLTEERRTMLQQQLHELMETEKTYLDSNLTLEQLARHVDVPKQHLTELLNVDLETNFYHYINGLRTREAMSLMQQGNFDGNLLHVCYASGFKSKSTFNKYFKELTGVTPKDYRNASVLTQD